MVHGLPDAMRVVFDDERAVANAGVLLPGMLAVRLGIEALVDRTVDLGDRAGAPKPGRKVMSLVSAMALGADCIDDCDVLRSGQTRAVLGHGVSAPSTLGTFLRAFTFGHVRQLDRVLADSLRRAWAAGAGPGDGRLVVDVDSFVGEVYGSWEENPPSAGLAAASFKGLADTVIATCGETWTTNPGNSSPPPANVSGSVPVVVSSQITKTGSVISGDTTEVVSVQVDPGCAGDPGHAGTGTVVGIVCGGQLHL